MKKIKHLGQHFLHDQQFLARITNVISASDTQLMVEIGPGSGNLTEHLLKHSHPLVAVEIDTRWATALQSRFAHSEHFNIINQDILDLEWQSLSNKEDGLYLVGNLPYQVTSPILFKLLEYRRLVSGAVFMMQREVAERITAAHGNKNYGILSVLIQHYYQTKLEFHVPAGAFSPPPKVVSSVIKLEKIRPEPVLPGNWDDYRIFVKTAFNQRRKKLRNTLKSYLGNNPATQSVLIQYLEKRPEQLSPGEFIDLYERIRQRSLV